MRRNAFFRGWSVKRLWDSPRRHALADCNDAYAYVGFGRDTNTTWSALFPPNTDPAVQEQFDKKRAEHEHKRSSAQSRAVGPDSSSARTGEGRTASSAYAQGATPSTPSKSASANQGVAPPPAKRHKADIGPSQRQGNSQVRPQSGAKDTPRGPNGTPQRPGIPQVKATAAKTTGPKINKQRHTMQGVRRTVTDSRPKNDDLMV